MRRTEPILLLTPDGYVSVSLVIDDAATCVVIEEPTDSTEVLVRIQSSCMFSESLGAIDCDCSGQLKEAIRRVKLEGGIVVYVFEEGRGAGLLAKFEAIRLEQVTGINTAQAFEALGLPSDPRDYGLVARLVRDALGPERSAVLLTNNPTRASKLIAAGVSVSRTEPLIVRTTANQEYLAGKAQALGHEV